MTTLADIMAAYRDEPEPSSNQVSRFLVDRSDLKHTSWRHDPAPSAADLAPGEAIVRHTRFALTANNITYARYGDEVAYWKFFPVAEPWGQIPVWGLGEVTHSRHPGLQEGERVYGYFPMASHLVIAPDPVKLTGFVDAMPHRAPLPKTYNEYSRIDHDPSYDPARADQHLVLRPLFALSFFFAEFLKEENLFGATRVILSSASSKTAMGLAFLLARAKPDHVRIVGLTSPSNAAFVSRAGCYDDVIGYDAITSLPTDAPVVFVDIAGDFKVLRAIHHHFGDAIRHSGRVGATHWDSPATSEVLPGIKPEFFFTPTHIVRRRASWGADLLRTRLGEDWKAFLGHADGWLRITHGTGEDAIASAYREVLEGRVPADAAHTLSFA